MKVRTLQDSGEIIDKVAESAGDLVRINGIRFDIDDRQPLQDEARARAPWPTSNAGPASLRNCPA